MNFEFQGNSATLRKCFKRNKCLCLLVHLIYHHTLSDAGELRAEMCSTPPPTHTQRSNLDQTCLAAVDTLTTSMTSLVVMVTGTVTMVMTYVASSSTSFLLFVFLFTTNMAL